jgi:hypothetical protein
MKPYFCESCQKILKRRIIELKKLQKTLKWDTERETTIQQLQYILDLHTIHIGKPHGNQG